MIERVGIIGGGQLGRMLTQSALPLGYEVMVLDPTDNCPAAQVGALQIEGGLTDTSAISELSKRCGVLTWEIEHIPAAHLEALAANGINIAPSPTTLRIIQDKLLQKQNLASRGIPVAPFSAELDEAAFAPVGGGPFIVKSRRGGYDGRGNLAVHRLDDPVIKVRFKDSPVYVEKAVRFEKELSIIAARDIEGTIKAYPAVETIHKENICHMVLAPAEVEPKIKQEASAIAEATLEGLEGAGVFAIEMFVVDGRVMVNEIAPRVHNSGHHTIEANVTSQFEQHIRAVTGMPLGETRMHTAAAAMINILGSRHEALNRTGIEKVLQIPHAHVHFYGKDPHPGRKIGHITILGSELAVVEQKAIAARAALAI